jgi:prepilin-type processing-associated H-X9-DG protein
VLSDGRVQLQLTGPSGQGIRVQRSANLIELPSTRWLHLPGERHGGGANLSFLDGHVQSRQWKYTPKLPISPSGHRPVNERDFEDMRWLVRHGAAWQRAFE